MAVRVSTMMGARSDNVAGVMEPRMSYCEHCEGQRFDRARVLRALRQVRKQLRGADRRRCEEALELALQTVRALEIPHLDLLDVGDEIIH
jgi:hypothetical protein